MGSFAVFTGAPAFTVYDLGSISLKGGSPRGGSYNVGFNVSLSGTGLVDYRGARCRFGGYQGSWAAVASGGLASCGKPSFPDEARYLKGEIGLEFSANGQCYGGGAVASFVVYNALVDALAVRGGVTGAANNTLRIRGEGFVSMAEGLCSLTPADETGRPLAPPGGAATYGALSVISPTEAACLAPRRDEGELSSGRTIAHFQLGVLLNGVQQEPSLWGAPLWTQYSLAHVRVTAATPPGGPYAEAVEVVLRGSGFMLLGEGQLVCSVNGAVVAGTLLDPSRLACTVPAAAAPGTVAVAVSLNGGEPGTFSLSAASYTYYEQPTLQSISPDAGLAEGGTQVTVAGRGFDRLPTADGLPNLDLLRCQFSEVSSSVSFVNATHVVCSTIWGSGTVRASLALNGASFAASTLSYHFHGRHAYAGEGLNP